MIEISSSYFITNPKWEQAKEVANDSISQFVGGSESTKQEILFATEDEVKAHPLSGSDKSAINKWFHDELSPKERSMILTVALFERINRKYMASISDEIRSRLFETTLAEHK